jgi:hypothetical protein
MKSTIKIFVFAMLSIFTVTQAYSQKCKYDIDKTDPFTGQNTKGITVKINNWFFFGFNKNGSNYDLGLLAALSYTGNSMKGDSIILKVVNEQNPSGIFLTLYSVADVKPTLQAATNTQYYYSTGSSTSTMYGSYRIQYEITEQQLELLSSGLVTDIRLFIGDKDFYVLDLKKKISESIRQAVICILR